MKRYFQSSVSALAMSALVMSSAVVATVGITAAPAFSQSSNANGNSSNGNRNARSNPDNRSNNGRGSTASSLGALNAAHANANALENAAETSRVGMIEIYKLAVGVTAEATEGVDAAEQALSTYIAKCVGYDAVIDNDGLETTPAVGPTETPEYCLDVLSDAAFEDGVTEYTPEDYILSLEGALDDAEGVLAEAEGVEAGALEAAANKATNDEVIIALWELLDLPED